MSDIKVGDTVRLRLKDDVGSPLFVGESDLGAAVGLLFVVIDIAQWPADYPIFCKPHVLYKDVVAVPIRNGISLKYEEVEMVDE